MLKIAVVGENYTEGKKFIEWKFREKIEKINHAKSVWTLKNGDEIHLCYGDPNLAKSFDFDAYLVSPNYQTLEDIVRYRCSR